MDWETSVVLDGEIGAHVAIARKEKDSGKWFVGAITNEDPRNYAFSLDFLDPDTRYDLILYGDSPDAHFRNNPEAYVINRFQVKKGDKINAYLAPGGGVAMSLQPTDTEMISENI